MNCMLKRNPIGTNVVTSLVKPLPATQAPITVPVCILSAPFPYQLSANGLGKGAEDGPSDWTWMKLLASVFAWPSTTGWQLSGV